MPDVFRGGWLRQVARGAAVLVGAWLLLSLLAWIAVPPLVKWQVQTRLAELVGRDVQIEKVAFNPLRLALTAEHLEVAAAAGGPGSSNPPALLTVGRLRVDFAASSFLQRAPVIEALTIDTVRLRLTRLAAGRYDIDDVLRRWAKPEGATSPGQGAIRFALYNAQLHDAAVRFDDRPAGRVQELTALDLAVPFLSNMPTKLDVQVAPRLAFKLNGVPFESSALATPFAATRSGALKLAVRSLDVVPYLGYLPSALPVRIESGRLSTDLDLGFAARKGAAPTFSIKGTIALQDFRVVEPGGAPLLAWRQADIAIRNAEPLARRVGLASVRLEGVNTHVRRKADGTLELPGVASPDATPAHTAPEPSSAASPPAASQLPPLGPWEIESDRIEVTDSVVAWNDAAVAPAAALRLFGLAVQGKDVHWPLREPFAFTAQASLESKPTTAKASAAGRIGLRGSVSSAAVALHASVERLPLAGFEGYVAQLLTPTVDGRVSAEARIDWMTSGRHRVVLDTATIEGFALGSPNTQSTAADVARPPVSIKRLSLSSVEINAAARGVKIGTLKIDEPSLSLVRGPDGTIDAGRWLVAVPAGPAASTPLAPWRIDVGEASLTGGRLQWTDAFAPGRGVDNPVRLAIADLNVDLQTAAWQGTRPTVPAHFKASGRAGLPQAPGEPASRIPGTFDWRGVVGVVPLEVIGSLKTERLPLHLLTPYFGKGLPVRIARVELGIDGQVAVRELPAGLDVDAGADVLLGAVRIEAARDSPGETLLSWNTLGMKDVRVAVKPAAKPKIDIAEAALTDFYSRLLVAEDGRLNVSTLGRASPPAPRPPPPARAASATLPIDLRVGTTTLVDGRIDFSDHFVRPNYSAALTGLSGRLGTIDSARPAMAPLTLRGKAAGTAQLEIDGAVDPLGDPPTLELHAKATDLELAPLSPYAGKYAGYGIERGKLSMDVAYRLGADGRLDATNRVVLNQLTFGDRIASPTATSLPVLLAVSLLKDRNGVIDLELPIRGSLEDPQFSIAAIIGRLLGNLIAKAITSPFSLLARGAGGGDAGGDPARVEFVPGTSRLATAGLAAVDTVAQALIGKPGLLLTVTGVAAASGEQEAYRSAVLDERIEAERRKASVASAAAASAPAPALSPDERLRLLRQLYRDTDLPDKPRNVFGFATDLPAAAMETRLKAAIEVDADTLRALALQRGVGVRDALISKGLASDRLFLAAPKVDDAAAAAPEARLALTSR